MYAKMAKRVFAKNAITWDLMKKFLCTFDMIILKPVNMLRKSFKFVFDNIFEK